MSSLLTMTLMLAAYLVWQSKCRGWIKYPTIAVIGLLVSIIGNIGNY